ncbi:hypothetical protein Ddye_030025 [Dipteronia dyeriana]|uniref:Uncharacterized protein n=1 Tax=Dipteronia dyeriana TaxID=168575 RepID=A0AAD9TG80_9ROSI|nr:hypothetical protein Ddye_030025 [Dipteronia dyeriana]
MAALQKFKILATQCGVTQSPTRSPRTSPLVQLPRKKTTLRMLLTRNTSRRSTVPLPLPALKDPPVEREIDGDSNEKKRDTSHKLKDLFVSSTTSFEEEEDKTGDRTGTEVVLMTSRKFIGLGREPGSARPAGWVGFRHRLLRKAWRPMLVAIPE